jgi:hypothetical protein
MHENSHQVDLMGWMLQGEGEGQKFALTMHDLEL